MAVLTAHLLLRTLITKQAEIIHDFSLLSFIGAEGEIPFLDCKQLDL